MSENAPKPRRSLPSIPNADTFVQELNVLQLEGLLFDFSRKHADKTTDIVEANDATGRSVRLNFDPRYGRPSILAYRVLQAIFRKLTSEGYPFGDTVSFSRHELMQLAGRTMGGAQSQELYRAIQQLRRTDITCEITDKASEQRDTMVFSLVNAALFSEHRGRVQACSLSPDPMIIKSLNDRHWAAFNWDRMKDLDPVGMVLYKQLFWQLCRLAGRTIKELKVADADHPMVVKSSLSEMRYNKDLGDIFAHWLGGLKLPPRKGKIIEKYGERLRALQAAGLIANYDIRKGASAGDFTLIVRPGGAFVSDYLDLYLSRYQPRLKYQSTSDQITIAEPLALVAEFHKGLNNATAVDTDVFSDKDRTFALQLIGKYGLDGARAFVDYALNAIKADGFPIRHFTGARQYVNPWLAGKPPVPRTKRRFHRYDENESQSNMQQIGAFLAHLKPDPTSPPIEPPKDQA